MKNIAKILLLLPLLFLNSCSNDTFQDLTNDSRFVINTEVKNVGGQIANVIILLGQSNATGISRCSCLQERSPETYSEANCGYGDVMINYYVDSGVNCSNGFVKTKLGQGMNQDYFGPEIGIAKTLQNEHAGKRFFIIKYSKSGSSLKKEWLNNNKRSTLYNESIAVIKNSFAYLTACNYSINLCGICWMQGETDATHLYGLNYIDSLSSIVSFYRDDLAYASSKIRFIDAGISDYKGWTFSSSVNSQKMSFSRRSEDNYYIDTIGLGLKTNEEPYDNPDLMHYDSLSEIELGKAFGGFLSQFVL